MPSTDLCRAHTRRVTVRAVAEHFFAVFYSSWVVTADRLLRSLRPEKNGDAENARHENARNAIAWNTECCICLSIAEQECMSRQERAPDFTADCVLVND